MDRDIQQNCPITLAAKPTLKTGFAAHVGNQFELPSHAVTEISSGSSEALWRKYGICQGGSPSAIFANNDPTVHSIQYACHW